MEMERYRAGEVAQPIWLAPRSRLPMNLMKLLREPLVHFLVLGAGLFLVYGRIGAPGTADQDEIRVTNAQIQRLAAGWERTWQRPPTPQELNGLVQDHILEEMLYREALKLGLDRDDTIIRRRLRQKMEFLAEDFGEQTDPTDAELQSYFASHPDQFRLDPRVSFTQLYINRDRRGAAAEAHAAQLLATLAQAGPALDVVALGDPLSLPAHHDTLPRRDVAGLFGEAFAAQLMEVAPERWVGPITSGYGLHVVRVHERIESRLPQFDEVRMAVQREFLYERRTQSQETLRQRLLEQYTVTVESPVDGALQAKLP